MEDEYDAKTLELLWRVRDRSKRGPVPAFTIDEVAATAVSVADEAGFEGVSMEEVARRLGYTKMSLYRYVSSKAELRAVMIDLAIGEPPALDGVRGGWRGQARRWADLIWETWGAHPWLPQVTLGTRPIGPNELGWSVEAVHIFASLDLSRREVASIVTLLSGYLRAAFAQETTGSQPWTTELRLTPSLADIMQRAGVADPELERLVRGRRSAVLAQRAIGLEIVLDGIQARIERRSGASR